VVVCKLGTKRAAGCVGSFSVGEHNDVRLPAAVPAHCCGAGGFIKELQPCKFERSQHIRLGVWQDTKAGRPFSMFFF